MRFDNLLEFIELGFSREELDVIIATYFFSTIRLVAFHLDIDDDKVLEYNNSIRLKSKSSTLFEFYGKYMNVISLLGKRNPRYNKFFKQIKTRKIWIRG